MFIVVKRVFYLINTNLWRVKPVNIWIPHVDRIDSPNQVLTFQLNYVNIQLNIEMMLYTYTTIMFMNTYTTLMYTLQSANCSYLFYPWSERYTCCCLVDVSASTEEGLVKHTIFTLELFIRINQLHCSDWFQQGCLLGTTIQMFAFVLWWVWLQPLFAVNWKKVQTVHSIFFILFFHKIIFSLNNKK